MQLEAEGFTVLHAASAEAALELAAQQPLSLITLDIALPNMDGWEFLGRIKQMPTLKHVPVVIISIVADFSKGFALGAAAVMQKPVTRKELYESLAELGLSAPADGRDAQGARGGRRSQGRRAGRRAARGVRRRRVSAHSVARKPSRSRVASCPDLIVLDLMMPTVSGFDVVQALRERADTARIPIVIVTAKRISADDRARLNGFVTTIMEKGQFDRTRFIAEVRRAMSGRRKVV